MRILYLPNEYSQQRQFQKLRVNIYPVLLAMEAEWYRKQRYEVFWDTKGTPPLLSEGWDKIISEPEGLPFLSLPHPDRKFTRWWEYQNNGNFKYLPATYIQSARDCWWGKCTFCRWAKKYPNYEVRLIDDVISEIEECKQMGFREIFDDSGTFPIGRWLDEFLTRFGHINKDIRFSCNMRLVDLDYSQLRANGFRMLLFGLESANQRTLDKINKGVKVEDVKYIIRAARCGLEPHVAAMIAFPWETYKDTMRTINLIKWLLIKGYAKTAQMSFYTPPPDQQQGNEKFRKYVNKFYEIGFDPRFWLRKMIDLHSTDDFKYLIKGLKEGWKTLLKK